MGFFENLMGKGGKKKPLEPGERIIGRKNAAGEIEHLVDPTYMRPMERMTQERSLENLEMRTASQADQHADALEKLESAEAQGESIAEDVKYEAEAKARAYGNAAAAFRTTGGEGPDRIRAIIGKLEGAAQESTGIARDELERTIGRLRELL
ncbi:MAG TPA: hypothetical protein VL283_01510 [Candidatus Baltobacteraceae bacterium]|nr:hypothetical protein [Candidatus Baltobacteraceae bacterium]